MTPTSSPFPADVTERTAATATQVAVGLALTDLLDLPPAWAILIAAVLAVLKALLARYVGNRDSASLAPNVGDV